MKPKSKIDPQSKNEISKTELAEQPPAGRARLAAGAYWKWIAIGFIGLFVFSLFFEVDINLKSGIGPKLGGSSDSSRQERDNIELKEAVLPAKGVKLPVKWEDLGKRMIEAGVIDSEKFESLYAQRGGLDEDANKLLYEEGNGELMIDAQNSGLLLNLFWALGLSNKNQILEEGPMMDKQYGGDASRFASTGGWSLGVGTVMDHYSMYQFVVLTPEQQELVERVSKNIYRPCCGNSVYFPDCNHGMAMLGLLELMAANGVSEEDMYKIALQVNSYWFPDTYLTIASYLDSRGTKWKDADPKAVLGSNFSSAAGYRQILNQVAPPRQNSGGGGGGCGV